MQGLSFLPLKSNDLMSNKHDFLGKGATLQGFPWRKFSCALDALLLMILGIVEAVGKDEYGGTGKVDSDIIPEVMTETLLLAKVPWDRRSLNMMLAHRDGIRAELWEKKHVSIGAKSALDHFETHILPPHLIEFPVSVKTSCLACQYVASDNKRFTTSRGLRFRVTEHQGNKFANLQDVLKFTVRFLSYQKLT